MESLDTDQVLEWIQAARAGDERSLRELIAAAMEYLFPAALAMLGERHRQGGYLTDALHNGGPDLVERMRDDGWEITHAACVRIATKLDTFRGRNLIGQRVRFSTWAYAIAQNEMRGLLRRRWREAKRRRHVVPDAPDLPDWEHERVPETGAVGEESSPEDALEERSTRALVREAVQEAPLTPEQRRAILLYYGLGYKQERIAAVTGVQVGTVKKRLFDGLKKLRSYVQERSETPPNREGRVSNE